MPTILGYYSLQIKRGLPGQEKPRKEQPLLANFHFQAAVS
jgi:hypothetical protein